MGDAGPDQRRNRPGKKPQRTSLVHSLNPLWAVGYIYSGAAAEGRLALQRTRRTSVVPNWTNIVSYDTQRWQRWAIIRHPFGVVRPSRPENFFPQTLKSSAIYLKPPSRGRTSLKKSLTAKLLKYAQLRSYLSLHADHLLERVHNLNQMFSRLHPRGDRFVGAWSFINHIGILAAFNARRGCSWSGQRELTLGLAAGHGTTRPVAAAHEALRVSQPAHNERLCPHAAGDDAHIALTRTHGALAGHHDVLTVMVLPGNVVVVAVHRLNVGVEGGHFPTLAHRADDVCHHQLAIRESKVLRPLHCKAVVVEVLGALGQVGQVLIGKIDHPLAHVFLGKLNERRADAVAHAT